MSGSGEASAKQFRDIAGTHLIIPSAYGYGVSSICDCNFIGLHPHY